MGGRSARPSGGRLPNGAVLMPSVKASGTAIEQTTKKTTDFSTSLRNLAQSFGTLAQIAGESGLGDFARAAGTVVGSMSLATGAITQFTEARKGLKAGEIEMTAGVAQMASAVLGAVGALQQATAGTNKWMAALGGAAVGLSFGGIWAVAGALYGFARAQAEANKQAEAARRALFNQKAALVDQLNAFGNARAAWRDLSDEFTALMFGPTTEATLKRMGEIVAEIQRRVNDTNRDFAELANDLIQAGYEIPAAFRPVLQQLIDLGVLSRENVALFADLTDEHAVNWKKMEEAGRRYGDWMQTELGPAFQQAKNTDFAKQIINDFDLLVRGGASVGSVLFGMKEEIVKLIQDSIKFGTTIPENMRPWIQELERAGLLIDENGEHLFDLGALKFAAPIETEFERITKAIEKLITTLDLLAVAIRTIPQPAVTVPSGTNVTLPTGDPVPYASGGLVTRPTYALLGERGPEAVIPLGRYGNPRAVPVPNLDALLPTFGKMPSDTPGGRGDFRQAIEELRVGLREDLTSWLEMHDASLAITLRDAVRGAI